MDDEGFSHRSEDIVGASHQSVFKLQRDHGTKNRKLTFCGTSVSGQLVFNFWILIIILCVKICIQQTTLTFKFGRNCIDAHLTNKEKKRRDDDQQRPHGQQGQGYIWLREEKNDQCYWLITVDILFLVAIVNVGQRSITFKTGLKYIHIKAKCCPLLL